MKLKTNRKCESPVLVKIDPNSDSWEYMTRDALEALKKANPF